MLHILRRWLKDNPRLVGFFAVLLIGIGCLAASLPDWSRATVTVGVGQDCEIQTAAPASGAGKSLTLRASNAVSGATNGGGINIYAGVKSGAGADGAITLNGVSNFSDVLGTGDGTLTTPADTNLSVTASGTGVFSITRNSTITGTLAQNGVATFSDAAGTGGGSITTVANTALDIPASGSGKLTTARAIEGSVYVANTANNGSYRIGVAQDTALARAASGVWAVAGTSGAAAVDINAAALRLGASGRIRGNAVTAPTPSTTLADHTTSGGYVTITTQAAHQLTPEQIITVSGWTWGAGVNGSYSIYDCPSTTTFRVVKGGLAGNPTVVGIISVEGTLMLGGVPTSPPADTECVVAATADGQVPLVLQAKSGTQTANLMQAQTSAGAVPASISATGLLTGAGVTANGLVTASDSAGTGAGTITTILNQDLNLSPTGSGFVTLPTDKGIIFQTATPATEGTFAVGRCDTSWGANVTPTIRIGWNWTPGDYTARPLGTQSRLMWCLEQYWSNDAGVTILDEANLDWTDATGLISRRPFAFSVNRASGVGAIGLSGSTIELRDDAQVAVNTHISRGFANVVIADLNNVRNVTLNVPTGAAGDRTLYISTNTPDASVIATSGTPNVFTADQTITGSLTTNTANTAALVVQSISENITIADSTSSTSATNLLPANSYIIGVVARVTTVLPNGPVTWSMGTAGDTTLFAEALQPGAAGTQTSTWRIGHVSPGGPTTRLAPFINATAAQIVITHGDPDAATGRIRVTVFYYTLTEPGS